MSAPVVNSESATIGNILESQAVATTEWHKDSTA